jgi:hypothetical protein
MQELSLELRSVSFDRVEFMLAHDEVVRPVTVLVASGRTWRQAVRFPNDFTDAGLGVNEETDELIRRRAAEELVRLSAAIDALEVRRAA